MITTITGYNGKKNKSTFVTAALSGMCSMTKGTKTLVIQLIDKDLESVEYILSGVEDTKVIFNKGLTFTNEGIDGLIRTADSAIRISQEDFDQMSLALRKENRLDVAEMTKSNNFTMSLRQRVDNIKAILRNANDVYDDVFVLLPSNAPDIVEEINEQEIVDRSIYCMTQGHFGEAKICGKHPIMLVTEFDEDSKYTLYNLRKTLKLNSSVGTKKLSYNVGASDAAKSSELLRFIANNRDLGPEDTNYQWYKDLKDLIADILGVNVNYMETDYTWENSLPFEKELNEEPLVKEE